MKSCDLTRVKLTVEIEVPDSGTPDELVWQLKDIADKLEEGFTEGFYVGDFYRYRYNLTNTERDEE